MAIDGGPFVVAAPGGGFIAVAADVHRVLVTLQSPDGQAWSQVNAPTGATCDPSAICGVTPSGLAVHGETIAMIGRDETTGVAGVWTSTDARAWTRIRTLPDLHRGELSGLVPTPSGFAAVVNAPFSGSGEIGVAIGGADGGSWSVSWLPAKSSAASQPMLAAVVATDAGYAALGEVAMAPIVWRSSDGRTWTPAWLPGAKDIGFGGSLVARGPALWAFVPVGIWQSATANASRWVSTDGGVTWAAGNPGPHFNMMIAIFPLAGGFVAIGRPAASDPSGGFLWTSTDGASWTAAAIGGGPSRPNDGMSSVAASNGHVVAAGWTDIDKGSASGDDAQARGRLVFWVGDAPAPPTLALSSPQPTRQPTASPSQGAASATQWPMPHQAPDVEALLPRKVGDRAYLTGSLLLPIETDVTGGDLCAYFCPGEVGGWARKLGVASGLVSMGFAAPDGAPGDPAVTVFALKLPVAVGLAPIADAKLEDAWAATHAVGGRQDVTLTLGGKRVRLVGASFFNRYIYAQNGTLYLVAVSSSRDLADPFKPGPQVDEVFAALP